MPTLHISKSAILHNLNKIKEKVKVPICAVVKADAYNHGAIEVSKIIYDLVNYFAVATEEEALALYESGIKKDIIILGEIFSGEKLPPNIIPTISSSASLISISKRCSRVHIKLNTGMNRMGCNRGEITEILSLAKKLGVWVCGAFTHFYNATSENETKLQFKRFQNAIIEFGYDGCFHICASSAYSLSNNYHLSMVRVGLALYGYGENCLIPAMSISAEVVWIGSVKAGEHVSYGDFTVSRDTRVCAIRVGYADGYRRGQVGACVSINGRKCSVLGRVCMDITVVDLGDTNCKVGDRVYLLGEAISMEDFCRYFQTIPHEALTMISKRIVREYE